MVRATKLVIKQISVHEFNPNFQLIKYAQTVCNDQNRLLTLILVNILAGLLVKMYWYTLYDNYFKSNQEGYQEYIQWKYNSTEPISDEREDDMERIERYYMANGQQAMLATTIFSSLICGGVFYCFRSFKDNLMRFEASPKLQG